MDRVNSRKLRCFVAQEGGWLGGTIFLISNNFYFYYRLFPQQLERSSEGMAKSPQTEALATPHRPPPAGALEFVHPPAEDGPTHSPLHRLGN